MCSATQVHGIFVTGTDTGVGKTLVSCALAALLRHRGARVAVMKPVETGCPLIEDRSTKGIDGVLAAPDHQIARPPPSMYLSAAPEALLSPLDALALMRFSGCSAPLDRVNPYRYALPVAPATAARLADRPIDPDEILAAFTALSNDSDFIIVEGAGGLLVPLTSDVLIIDLIARMHLPALLVGRSILGTINHCLLSIEALQRRAVPLRGVVLNRPVAEPPRPEEATNPEQIERFAGPVVRGVLPHLDDDQREDANLLASRFRVHVDVDALLDP